MGIRKRRVRKTNAGSRKRAVKTWVKNDNKAKSDIILSIKPSKLKQLKGCVTSREVWLKLENMYLSKGLARKTILLKQLMLQCMEDGDDVREHVQKFFDIVDKLAEINVEINSELLAIMLLYRLPPSFDNFRCAIESRDELPSLDVLRIKIMEESDTRKKKKKNTRGAVQNAMIVKKRGNSSKDSKKIKIGKQRRF